RRAPPAPRRRGESELFVDTLADLLLVIPPGVASTVITDAASVRGLSSFDTSLRHRGQLHGVVTYVDPIWRLLFVQDHTAGVFLNTEGAPLPMTAGDSMEVSGVTDTRGLDTSVFVETMRVRGREPIPAAPTPSLDALRAGAF